MRCVFGVVIVAQDVTADPQDHRPVPIDERREGRLIAALDEPLEQLSVAQSAGRSGAKQSFDLFKESHPSKPVISGQIVQ